LDQILDDLFSPILCCIEDRSLLINVYMIHFIIYFVYKKIDYPIKPFFAGMGKNGLAILI
jgi:hypothetical protein